MQHFHRLLLVAVAIIVLYLIKQRFDAGRKKEGFLSAGEYVGIGVGIWIVGMLLLILLRHVDKKTFNWIYNAYNN